MIWGRGLLSPDSNSAFTHDDFLNLNPVGVVPSHFFVGIFLLDALGTLFMAATVLSLLVCFSCRKVFSKILVFDLICLATIVSVVSVNTFLGVSLNLNFPYHNAVKYNYQSLPFFSLLAASLVGKYLSLFSSVKSKKKLNSLLFSVAFVGLVLLAVAMLLNMNQVHQLSTWDYLLFRVEMDKTVGYSFVNPSPTGKQSLLMNIQYLGFAFVLSGLVWASRHNLVESFTPMRNWIELKNALSHERQKNFRNKSYLVNGRLSKTQKTRS